MPMHHDRPRPATHRGAARRPSTRAAACAAALLLWSAGGALAAPAAPTDQPVKPLPQSSAPPATALQTRTTSLPAKGLFVGDQLSPSARARLAEFIVDAIGQQIEVALVVPTGPWQIEDQGRDERDLTPARLQAVRRFLSERGVDAKRIFVESRVDARIKEPRLDIQTVSRPATD